jgi:SAM-dependent methyltransferase
MQTVIELKGEPFSVAQVRQLVQSIRGGVMQPGERQVAPTLDGIRRDHVARYEWAASRITQTSHTAVLDLACGVGYGTKILADAGLWVHGVDNNAAALAYAKKHFSHDRAGFHQMDASALLGLATDYYNAAVCFETIEHIEDPLPLLVSLRQSAPMLFASVPNEDVFPWNDHRFHFRHYTKQQFQDLLGQAGWHVTEWWGQSGPESEVEPNVAGRTIIAVAERGPVQTSALNKPPGHVAIVAMGPSGREFAEIAKRAGGRRAFCDEVWGINAMGDVLACDRVFHMDDVRVQEIRAAARPDSNIAQMLKWMKSHPGPIVTSRAHPDYPGLVEFPLEDVINDFPEGYFNSTAAYAVAYAVHLGVTKITCFGMDFTYPDAHTAEKGRACVEFWLGIAAARGIKLSVPKCTSLLDAFASAGERFYGYDCVEIGIARQDERIKFSFTAKTPPTAQEIEERYDHNQHPNPLVPDPAG